MNQKPSERKTLKDFTALYGCRFHPTNGWHEVGCPHQTWRADQLQEALNAVKQSNAYLGYLAFEDSHETV